MARAQQQYTTPPNSHGHTLPHMPGPYAHQSPIESATGTPVNLSPSSPRKNEIVADPLSQLHQRGPKSPMYTPAVLRPTERPHRPSPLTPPRSVHGSTDSLDGTTTGRPVSRRSTAESSKKALGKVSEDESIPTDDLGPITGPPTREHWKPDANALICDAPICQTSFSFLQRRHHCRYCGHVFCNTHSSFTIPLNHDAEFHPKGPQCRACQHCYNQYCKWRAARISRANSISGGAEESSTPIVGINNRREAQKSVASSVPRDWNWSTF